MKKNIGIALSGGGARGAYQIGVLEVLKEAGLLTGVNAYSGSSVGSLNAVIVALDNIKKAKDIWLNMDDDSLFHNEQNFFKKIFSKGTDLVYDGYYKTDNLSEIIDDVIDNNYTSNKDIYVTTSHVGSENPSFFELLSLNIRNAFSSEGHVRYTNLKNLDNKTIKKTLLASCAIPVVFKPIIINHQTYYDGGVLDNTPIAPLIEHGCEEIILIDLFRFHFKRLKHDDSIKVHSIKPSKSLRGIMDFSRKQIIRRYELGKKDAHTFLKTLNKE